MQMKQHNLARCFSLDETCEKCCDFPIHYGAKHGEQFHGDESQGRHHNSRTTLPETNRKFEPKNGWLEDNKLFSEALAVSQPWVWRYLDPQKPYPKDLPSTYLWKTIGSFAGLYNEKSKIYKLQKEKTNSSLACRLPRVICVGYQGYLQGYLHPGYLEVAQISRRILKDQTSLNSGTRWESESEHSFLFFRVHTIHNMT